MKVHMTFKHMDATEALKNAVNEKSDRLQKFVGADTELQWVRGVAGGSHLAYPHVTGPHLDLFAQARTPDMYTSIDEVAVKIDKQLKKKKEITKDHLHRDR